MCVVFLLLKSTLFTCLLQRYTATPSPWLLFIQIDLTFISLQSFRGLYVVNYGKRAFTRVRAAHQRTKANTASGTSTLKLTAKTLRCLSCTKLLACR